MGERRRDANGNRRRKARARVLSTADRCAICGGPLDTSIPTPDPMSVEVDEIVPFSLGGSPYDLSNLQAVHRICNERKGNRMYWAQRQAPDPTPKRSQPTTSQDWSE